MEFSLTSNQTERLLQQYVILKDQVMTIPSQEEEGFFFHMRLQNHVVQVTVYDDLNEIYVLFDVIPSPSALASRLQQEYRSWLQDAISSVDMVEYWTSWIESRFSTIGKHPFKKTPNATTFLTKQKKKWFALLIEVPMKVIDPTKSGKVWLLNLKVDPLQKEQLIDGEEIVEAYHMNKHHWVSIVLSSHSNHEKIQELLITSYQLVEPEKSKWQI